MKLPAMYNAADKASRANQMWHFIFFAGEFFALVLISVGNAATKGTEVNSVTVIFLVAIFAIISAARRFNEWEKKWYQSRALAESIKTTAWRYAVNATPFDIHAVAKQQFRDYLAGLLKSNRHLGSIIQASDVDGEQITSDMEQLRRLSVNDRKEKYLQDRVRNQQRWYSKKSKQKGRNRTISYVFLSLLTLLLIVSVFYEIRLFGINLSGFDPILTLLTGIIGWVEVKRYSELEASYGLTSHEIGIILTGTDMIQDEESLSDFVNQAERAFSREHTQWLARIEAQI